MCARSSFLFRGFAVVSPAERCSAEIAHLCYVCNDLATHTDPEFPENPHGRPPYPNSGATQGK